jgi:hypothetical protein
MNSISLTCSSSVTNRPPSRTFQSPARPPFFPRNLASLTTAMNADENTAVIAHAEDDPLVVKCDDTPQTSIRRRNDVAPLDRAVPHAFAFGYGRPSQTESRQR